MVTVNDRKELEVILKEVSDVFGISTELIIMKGRKPEYVRPRQIAHTLAKELTRNSFAFIGSHIGLKDHATVLHGHRTILNEITTNKDLKIIYNRLYTRCDIKLSRLKDYNNKNERLCNIKFIKNNLVSINAKIAFNELIKNLRDGAIG